MDHLQAKRILITGGAGLVGSHIADLLLRENNPEVIVFDNFVRGRRENLTWAMANGRVQIVTGDIRDTKLLREAMQGIDLVFHQAAIRITQCAEEPRLALEVLADGTFNVLEAAMKCMDWTMQRCAISMSTGRGWIFTALITKS